MFKITAENVSLFAHVNSPRDGMILGIVIEFHGLGDTSMPESVPGSAVYTAAGTLYVRPYYGPWSWMNDVAVQYCDDVLDALIARHGLTSDIPVAAIGGSMGGLSALVFARYSRHNIVACAANCPVCDLPFHYTERKDLPRTLHAAFGHYACSLAAAMKSASPFHLAHTMPAIPYYFVHGDADTAVNKEKHSDRFVEQMVKCGHDVTYAEIPGMAHCALTPEARQAYNDFILSHII